MSKLKAYAGCYLLEKIKEETTVNLGNAKSKHVIYGKIIDVGQPRIHDSGGKLEPFCKVGQTLFFINYGAEEKYEEFDWEGKTYMSVIFNDSRAYLE
jgi:co-chaperonin GroES (HSP10)